MLVPRSAEHALDIKWRDLRSVEMECAHHTVVWIMDASDWIYDLWSNVVVDDVVIFMSFCFVFLYEF